MYKYAFHLFKLQQKFLAVESMSKEIYKLRTRARSIWDPKDSALSSKSLFNKAVVVKLDLQCKLESIFVRAVG